MVADPHVFEVVIDEARLTAAEPEMCASLLHQNRAFQARLLPEPWPERLRRFGVLISALGGVLGVFLLVLTAIIGEPRWWPVLPLLAFFGATLALFLNGPRLQAIIDRLPPKTIARRMRRTVAQLQTKCPYTIVYAFDELGYRVEADALSISKRVDFENYEFAIATKYFVHLYRNEKALSPKAIVYFADETHRDEVRERLRAANVTITTRPSPTP